MFMAKTINHGWHNGKIIEEIMPVTAGDYSPKNKFTALSVAFAKQKNLFSQNIENSY